MLRYIKFSAKKKMSAFVCRERARQGIKKKPKIEGRKR